MFLDKRAINVCVTERKTYMDIAFGTKIFNQKTKTIGLLICTWKNQFADEIVDYSTCVDEKGKRYNIELDKIMPLEDFE